MPWGLIRCLEWTWRIIERPLTPGEVALVASVFGDTLDAAPVRIRRAKFWMLHPAWITMAPDGHIWFHPNGYWSEDFSVDQLWARALFIHEMTHVWQVQHGGSLVFRRLPFARYGYRLTSGKPFARYGIEQQASIVEHAYLARERGDALEDYAAVIPFGGWT